ncbi:hypothetical protein BaRGS_00010569 [Batillaria attramentaria]|uniref:Uncharacterized protein n=1 Tax=Batillaria attramentaria TaxID=370345 RepID=A0ABD0LH76_9CAEN
MPRSSLPRGRMHHASAHLYCAGKFESRVTRLKRLVSPVASEGSWLLVLQSEQTFLSLSDLPPRLYRQGPASFFITY